MLKQHLSDIYAKFKLNFYRKIFSRFETREATLTAVETFCVEVIHALGRPTINQFAEFVRISQSNAAYKIGSLVKKGYLKRIRSEEDRREYHLDVTEKFMNYYGITSSYLDVIAERIQERFSSEEIAKFTEFLRIIAEELMPETEVLAYS